MQFLSTLFGGSDTNALLNSAFALGLTLVLIVLGLWVLKLITNAGDGLARNNRKRVQVVDTAVVDSKRKIIIIRRDNVEHLIMTGGPQDVVIESGISAPEPHQQRRAPQRPAAAARPQPKAEPAKPAPAAQPHRPVPREALDHLRELARPAPLKPQGSLRNTGLLRTGRDDDDRVIPIGPALRVDNSAGPPSDSAKTGSEQTGGQTRVDGTNRFFRKLTGGDRPE